MKKLLLITVFLASTFVSYSQDWRQKLRIEIGASPCSFVVNKKNLRTPSFDYASGYFFTERFSLKLCINETLLLDRDTKSYVHTTGAALGLGYFVYKNEEGGIEMLAKGGLGTGDNTTDNDHYYYDVTCRLFAKNIFMGLGVKQNFYDSNSSDLLSVYACFGFKL